MDLTALYEQVFLFKIQQGYLIPNSIANHANPCKMSMKAIVIDHFGRPEVLFSKSVPKPIAAAGEVLISVKAFGLNHAEMHMRKGEWDEWNAITGLECVGIVENCPGGEIKVGSKVAAVMGGMGRNRPGGYGEYVTCPVSNVIPIETSMAWEDLAALPEVYGTACLCLHTVLELKRGERILIRGATSTVGQAALNLAVNIGAIVTATTRSQKRIEWLMSMGVSDVELESPELPSQLQGKGTKKFDKVLNLIGNSVLLQSISLTRTGGRMLQAGWLGGLAPVVDFNPMLQMETGVHFSLFHSKVLGTSDFPISLFPLQEIVDKIECGEWSAKPVKVFEYDEIQEAHKLLDSDQAGGKIVVKH